MNLILRSVQIAIALSRQTLHHKHGDVALDQIWEPGFAPEDVLEQYTLKERSGAIRTHTVSEFQAQLKLVPPHVFRSILVFYLAAFERFLKRWAIAAVEMLPEAKELAKLDREAGVSLNAKHHKNLRRRARVPHESVRVNDLANVFEKAVRERLEKEEPVRRKVLPKAVGTRLEDNEPARRPSGSAVRFFEKHQWHCMDVTEMWRQVRNVVVHHDGALDRIEERRCRDMWIELSRHSPKELPRDAHAPISDHHVDLEGYHVVYCFTNTWTTVHALLDALADLEKLALHTPRPVQKG